MTLSHWLRKLTNRPSTISSLYASRSGRSQRLAVELLEDRLAPAASLLAFTTSPQTIVAGQLSSVITVQLQDQNDQPVQAGPGGVALSLGSTSTFAGMFQDTAGNPLTNFSLTIAPGSSTANFEYEDSVLGTPTLTVAAAGLASAVQRETIDADLVVTNFNDAGPGSLRDAIQQATSGDTIGFAGPFPGTIYLQTPLPLITTNLNIVGPSSSLLIIDGQLSGVADQGLIGVASGATVTVTDLGIDQSASGAISNSGNLTVKRLDIQSCNASAHSGSSPYGGTGGIYNDGTLAVFSCNIVGNAGDAGSAAAIDNENRVPNLGQATITDSSISFNGAGALGTIFNNGSMTLTGDQIEQNSSGGILNRGALAVVSCAILLNTGAAGISSLAPTEYVTTITDSTIAQNGASGIVNDGTMTLTGDSIQGNGDSGIQNGFGTLTVDSTSVAGNTTAQSAQAAGIDISGGTVSISDSTISGNSTAQAGALGATGGIGVYQFSLLAISNSTVAYNVTDGTNTSGGGIDALGSSATIFDTIVAKNTGSTQNPTDVSGAFTSMGHNWIGIADSHSSGFVASDIVGTVATPQDPGLAAGPGDNGGPTPSIALLPGSPCIDAGDNTDAPATDQRGAPRIAYGTIDIGAFEFQIFITPSTLPALQVGATNVNIPTINAGVSGATFAVTAGALPAGESLATNGSFSGTPTAGGDFTFTVTATITSSGTTYTGSETYTLVVDPPTIIISPSPPGAPVNAAYSQQLTAAGGTAPYSNFIVSAGTLPPGITLSPTGLLSGTPTQAGAFLFTVSATDSSTGSGPYTSAQQLAILVTPPGFTYQADFKALTIDGTAAQNEFDYAQSTMQDSAGRLHTTFAFTLNGVELDVPDSLLLLVNVEAQGQHNTAVLTTNDTYFGVDGLQHETSETVSFGGPYGSTLVRAVPNGSFNDILLVGFQTIYAYMGRADTGTLYGTSQQGGENIFVSAGTYSYVTGLGQYYEISGAPTVYGYAVNSGDQAWHYDTAAMDSFVASGNAYSYMSGTDNGQSFFNEAVGFQITYAISTHGQSYAYLIDSPGNDVFVGYAPYSYMSGSDNAGSLFNVAEGFLIVYGESFVGGTDFAYNFDPGHNILNSRWILLT